MNIDQLYIHAQELGATPEQAAEILDRRTDICGCGDGNGFCCENNVGIIEKEVAKVLEPTSACCDATITNLNLCAECLEPTAPHVDVDPVNALIGAERVYTDNQLEFSPSYGDVGAVVGMVIALVIMLIGLNGLQQ